jgi:hypothetical protein
LASSAATKEKKFVKIETRSTKWNLAVRVSISLPFPVVGGAADDESSSPV